MTTNGLGTSSSASLVGHLRTITSNSEDACTVQTGDNLTRRHQPSEEEVSATRSDIFSTSSHALSFA